MLGGPNADLLRDIQILLHRQPGLAVKYLKVKAHQKWDALSVHELLNNEVDELTNTVHDDPNWQAQDGSQAFPVHCRI